MNASLYLVFWLGTKIEKFFCKKILRYKMGVPTPIFMRPNVKT